MDQIRAFFGWLKRQHFWVLSAIITIVAVACWFKAASALQEKYKANTSKINQEFSAQDQLSRQPHHANDEINKVQGEQNQAQAAEVQALWDRLYAKQQDSVLKWPDALPEWFHRNIKTKDFGDDIPNELRQSYRDYAKRHFPELPKIIKAPVIAGEGNRGMGGVGRGQMMNLERLEEMIAERRAAASNRGRGRRGGDEAAEDDPLDDDFLVFWTDQDEVRQQLTFAKQPSDLKIWVTQEDLWVYTTLLRAIANTNDAAGATRFSNAAIRVIDSLEVGKDAAQQSRGQGRVLRREAPGAAGPGGMEGMYGGMEGYAGMEGGMEMGGYGMEMGGYGGMEGYGEFGGYGMEGAMGGGGDEAATLLSRRYLSNEGEPIEVSEGWSPSDFGTEYKQLPVRLALQMDHRWLYQLISELSNAPLQVEVQEVRVNPLGGQNRMSSASGRLYSFAGKRGGTVSMPSTAGRNADVRMFDRRTNIVPVIIQGTVYIFNKPDPDQFQVDSEAA